MRLQLLLFIFILASKSAGAQECFDFYKTNCIVEPSKYIYQENKASVSFLFEPGESRSIPFEMYSGKDYRITVCASDVFQEVIGIRLIRPDGKKMYDNSTNSFSLNMEFYCPKTQSVTIEISAPDASIRNDSIIVNGCIGVVVEEMVSPKTGF